MHANPDQSEKERAIAMKNTTHQTADTSGGAGDKIDRLKIGYEQLCKSHDAIDSFRSTLLGLLPAASAGGIFLLLNKDIIGAAPCEQAPTLLQSLLGPIGIFGFVITLGFFAYELYGIRKCHAIILEAQRVESRLGITGPFTTRPRELLGFINEPFAAGIIYPAVMAAWAFVAVYFTKQAASSWISGLVFFAGFAAMLFYNLTLKRDAQRRHLINLNERMLRAEEAGDQAALASILAPSFKILRADGNTYNRKQYLSDVPAKKDRGRSVGQVEVRVSWLRKAVLTCQVTTARDANGQPAIGHFKNTQEFELLAGAWQCTDWRVLALDAD